MAGGEEFPGVMAPSRARAVLSLHSGVLGEIEVKFSHCQREDRDHLPSTKSIVISLAKLFTMMEGQ